MQNNLYDRRKELGLTLEQVGDMCGVGKSTVRKWENGMINNMGRDKIVALAKALKVSPLFILQAESCEPILSRYDMTLLSETNKLNDIGQKEALKRVKELTYIPKYCKEIPEYLQPNAAHEIVGATEEDKQFDDDIMNDENF
nr:MAG TPA: helix-turn-helix domain protein [Caudoviricetes sp.]